VDPRNLLAVAVALVMGWFALGMTYNLRLGRAQLRWIQVGLPRIGERTTYRWLGSSVAELVIAQAKRPFRSLTTLIVLSPRDVPPLWIWALLHGRRDTLILRGQLVIAPKVELELADPASWTGRIGLEQAVGLGWQSEPYGKHQLMTPPGLSPRSHALLEALASQLAQVAPDCRRFALRRSDPHFELHIPLPDTRQVDADALFAAVCDLARAASQAE
jgi:hypothetical protein